MPEWESDAPEWQRVLRRPPPSREDVCSVYIEEIRRLLNNALMNLHDLEEDPIENYGAVLREVVRKAWDAELDARIRRADRDPGALWWWEK